MRIYLGAQTMRGPELQGYKRELEAVGHTVTSSWLNYDLAHYYKLRPELVDKRSAASMAVDCLKDLDISDAIVVFTGPNDSGVNVELGYAIAQRKLVYVIGTSRNIFHELPHVTHHFDSWASAFEVFKVYKVPALGRH